MEFHVVVIFFHSLPIRCPIKHSISTDRWFNDTGSIDWATNVFLSAISVVVAIKIISLPSHPATFVVVNITSRANPLDFILLSLESYRDTHHRFVDAILTAKLGLWYITGVLELLLGALIYVMCLPFVRKTGHFQVSEKDCFRHWCDWLLSGSYSTGVICWHCPGWSSCFCMGRPFGNGY